MPNQDAVIAITSGVKNMQAVLDLVWEKLLPAMDSTPLPADPVTQEKLQIKLASLAVPVQNGTATSGTAESVSGKTFTLETAADGWETIRLKCGTQPGAEPTLVVRRGGVEHQAVCGFKRWVKGTLPVHGADEQPVALSGAWTSDDTYAVKICLYETPHCLTLQLKFAGEQLQLDAEMNVDFGPTKHPTLIGKVQP